MRISYSVLLVFGFLFFSFSQKPTRQLFLNAGTQSSWERDFAYSPLVYNGASLGLTLGYLNQGIKKRDEIHINYSKIGMSNHFDAEMTAYHASIQTFTFYKGDKLPEFLEIGWSNNNGLSVRNFEDALNFTPRFDFHTSFGAAVRVHKHIGDSSRWKFSSQAHIQLIGFLFSSSFVTSPPDPFFHESSTFRAFRNSIRFFEPFSQQDLAVLNQVFYQLKNGNEIGLGYRFHYTALKNAQRSQRSGGHYFIQLNFKL